MIAIVINIISIAEFWRKYASISALSKGGISEYCLLCFTSYKLYILVKSFIYFFTLSGKSTLKNWENIKNYKDSSRFTPNEVPLKKPPTEVKLADIEVAFYVDSVTL